MGEAALAERVYKPTEYKTFSRKLAPSLSFIGGALAVAGGLGVWVRATELAQEGLAPVEVASHMGYSEQTGIAIAAVGGALVVSSVVWLLHFRILKLIPLLSSIALAVLVAAQLPRIDASAAALAERAREEIDFVAFHAGYGWGAWCMLAGAVLAVLGASAGVLRELDVRKGISG